MPLSWNEIKERALEFSREWANECSEDAEGKSFWDGFFNVFGITRKRLASFEQRVKKLDGRDGYIDLLWKGKLLVEQKSRGKNLDRAFQQATDYFPGLKERELPRYILVCDFERFRLYDLETDERHEFMLSELVDHVHVFGFIAGYQTKVYREQDPVNIKAAERMGQLHDVLQALGYDGHALEVYLVRLLFCLFAEDTGIFEPDQFRALIEDRTAEDGQDLGQWLATLFEVLNTPLEKRMRGLDEQLAAFPYINGQLFAEHLFTAPFDRRARELLLECSALDWGAISPAIFGSLFQNVMDSQGAARRRQLGAHYTTEKNILKLIEPLFLDELRAEFQRIKRDKRKLFEFQQYLARLKFLDPACGCGNFLVIAYRELRLLELEVLRALFGKARDLSIGVGEFNILCNVDQFYGIEIEELPAQIAQTALWLIDHQMNMLVSKEFGIYFARLPLKKSATIVHGNALQVDWREIVPPADLNYILGNPPFGGKQYQTNEQKKDLAQIFCDIKGAGVLDFVAPWYRKSTEFMEENKTIKTAFVSTNSITQGEQVGILWPDLIKRGVKIHFAHRTFQWSSEAKGKAKVHCVIIGFALFDSSNKKLFEYETPQSDAHEINVKNINSYLVEAKDIILEKRRNPISKAPEMVFGSMPNDGGYLILSESEKEDLIKKEPLAQEWIHPFSMGDDFINAIPRYCIWLVNISPNTLRQLPNILKRVEKVKQVRLDSKRQATQALANYPTLFGEIRQPKTSYLAVPRVSSERRSYIPIGFLPSNHIAGDKLEIIPDATNYHFGILTSAMHMAWMRCVCGRLKSDYSYSINIVYNNFPWPDNPTPKRRQAIETAAQAVLDARAAHPNVSLATLYDPLTMPPELVKAHRKLDAAVDAAYSKRKFTSDSDRVALLFERYQELVAGRDSKTVIPKALTRSV